MSDENTTGNSSAVASSVVHISGDTEGTDSQRLQEKMDLMSTQLLESINKQSELETQLGLLHKQLSVYQKEEAVFEMSKQELLNLKKENDLKDQQLLDLNDQLATEIRKRENADLEANGLTEEIGVLSTTLFEEANRMVAVEKRKLYETDQENKKLQGILKEKDDVLESLTLQLKNLKDLLEVDSQSVSSTRDSSTLSITGDSSGVIRPSTSGTASQYQSTDILVSPTFKNIRFDTDLYTEFLKFIAVLPHCDSIYSTRTESKLIKRLIKEEIEPALKIDAAKGVLWAAKSKVLPAMIAGEVVIEPLSGINETYRSGPGNHSFKSGDCPKDLKLFRVPADSPPVAFGEPCAFCSESRSDILEHSRLYCLKIFSTKDPTVISKQYPLCHYCLLKIRQSCEIFAFLRALKDNLWNLEPVTLKNIMSGEPYFQENGKPHDAVAAKAGTPTTQDARQQKKNRRRSFMESFNSMSVTPVYEPQVEVNKQILDTAVSVDGHFSLPNSNIQRAWLQLCKLRATLHWTEIGIWSVDDCVSSRIVPFSKASLQTAKQVTEQSFDSSLVIEKSDIIVPSSTHEVSEARQVPIAENDVLVNELHPEAPADQSSNGKDHDDIPVMIEQESHETSAIETMHNNQPISTNDAELAPVSSEEDEFFDSVGAQKASTKSSKGKHNSKKSASSKQISDLYQDLESLAQDVETALH